MNIPTKLNPLAIDKKTELTFTALQKNSSVKLTTNGSLTLSTIEYNKNNNGWIPYTINDLIELTNIGDKVKFRNTTNSLSTGTSNYAKFEMTGQINASGNCMSMLNNVKVCPNLCFANLFNGCSSLITPPEILCTTLGSSCFYQMFRGCTSLIRVPRLNAKIATHTCYNNMFYGCTSLTTIPTNLLPATTLNTSCYYGMFHGCISLTNVCNLPATSLANSCYYSMFENCQSLTTIPTNLLSAAMSLTDSCYRQMFRECSNLTNVCNLPATTLAPNCYRAMFGGVNGTSIASLPSNFLPITDLQENCYRYMFQNCKKLTNSCNLPATTLANYCYDNMFYGCTSLTTCGTISATSGVIGSCSRMFQNCTSLTIPPTLNFTSVGEECCMLMFYNCTSLLTAPELNATTLGINCYNNMFYNCNSLTVSPELPAIAVPNRAYYQMFLNCSSLTSMGEMKAVILGTESCYQMFNGCSNLTGSITINATDLEEDCFRGAFASTKITSATLLATTLANRCYWYIFQNCQYLTSIRVNFTDWSNASAADPTYGWCSYSQSTPFSSTGTFYKPSSLSEEYGVNRIPTGWNVNNSSSSEQRSYEQPRSEQFGIYVFGASVSEVNGNYVLAGYTQENKPYYQNEHDMYMVYISDPNGGTDIIHIRPDLDINDELMPQEGQGAYYVGEDLYGDGYEWSLGSLILQGNIPTIIIKFDDSSSSSSSSNEQPSSSSSSNEQPSSSSSNEQSSSLIDSDNINEPGWYLFKNVIYERPSNNEKDQEGHYNWTAIQGQEHYRIIHHPYYSGYDSTLYNIGYAFQNEDEPMFSESVDYVNHYNDFKYRRNYVENNWVDQSDGTGMISFWMHYYMFGPFETKSDIIYSIKTNPTIPEVRNYFDQYYPGWDENENQI